MKIFINWQKAKSYQKYSSFAKNVSKFVINII